jgi:hypothetical protein
MPKDRAGLIVTALDKQGWGPDEFLSVVDTIQKTPSLLAQITFDGGITLALMLKGRELLDNGPAVNLGKCHTPYCNGTATVKAWGAVYCAGCHESHAESSRRRHLAR